jgi:hypothetical protein
MSWHFDLPGSVPRWRAPANAPERNLGIEGVRLIDAFSGEMDGYMPFTNAVSCDKNCLAGRALIPTDGNGEEFPNSPDCAYCNGTSMR